MRLLKIYMNNNVKRICHRIALSVKVMMRTKERFEITKKINSKYCQYYD